MKVIKLGGSLYSDPQQLLDCLQRIVTCSNKDTVIVPGGGPFADQVRDAVSDYGIDELAAHGMALRAMQQFAQLLCSLQPELSTCHTHATILKTLEMGRIPVWASYMDGMQEYDGPKNWDSTSDSLALWLAIKLKASCLYIVKSADTDLSQSIPMLVNMGVLDSYFAQLYPRFSGSVTVLGKFDVARYLPQ